MASDLRIVVTGGSGKAGRWVVRDLRAAGHDVLNVDVAHDGAAHGQTVLADLTDLGQCHEVVAGADAVVHLAAIPAPEIKAAGETFRNNALSKLVGEAMADQFARRTGIPFVGFRISNIMEPPDYARFETWQDDARVRKWNLWGYVDARDVAQAVARALEADIRGAEVAIVAAADTCMRRPSAELMAEVYPDVELRRPIGGRETLLAIDGARELLGYAPAFSWLDPAAR